MQQVVTELIVDARPSVEGEKQFEQAMAKASVAAERTQGVMLATGQSAGKLGTALERIKGQVDPLYASQAKLEKQLGTLDAAYRRGLVTEGEATSVKARLIAIQDRNRASLMGEGAAAERTAERLKLLKEISLGFVGGIGAGVLIGGLTELPTAISEAVDKLGNIANLAQTIGVTTEALQQLRYAARLSDVEVGSLDNALQKFSVNAGKTDSPLRRIFEVNNKAITGDVLKDLETYADLVKNATTQEQRNVLTTTAFGKSAAEMGRLFERGGAGIAEWARQAEAAGAVVSDDKIQRARQLNDELEALKPQLETAQSEFALLVMPAEIAGMRLLVGYIRDLRDTLSDISNGNLWGALQLIASLAGQTASVGRRGVAITVNGGASTERLPGGAFTGGWGSSAFDRATKLPPPPPDHTAERAAKAYADLTRNAHEFIEQQNLATQSLGLGAEAAARLQHQQELLNRAADAHIKLSPEQRRELIGLANDMAHAEVEAKQYTDLIDTLADALGGLFDKPIKDAGEFFDTILSGFGSLGQANLKTGLQNILTGHGFAANDNGSSWTSATAKVFGDAVKAGAKDGTHGGLTDFIKNIPGGAGTVNAGLGGLGIGYQSQNPLMGAIGGALSGAAAGPWGAVAGGVAGLIGGLFGMNEALEKSKQALKDNRASIDQFIAAGLGTTLDADATAVAQFAAQGKQLIDAAKAAGDTQLVARLNAAIAAYKNTLAIAHDRDNLREAYERESAALQETIDKNKAFIASLKEFQDSLLTSELSPLSPQDRFISAQGRFNEVSQRAALGDQDAQGQLQQVIQDYLVQARAFYGSSDAYARIFDQVQGVLEQQVRYAQGSVSVDQQQLDAMTDQVSTLIDINTSVISVRDAILSLQGHLALQGHAMGGLIGYAGGGMIANGMWNRDSVIARLAGGGAVALAGGEHVTRAPSVNRRTYPTLDYINRTGSVPGNDNGAVVAALRAIGERIGRLEATTAVGAQYVREGVDQSTSRIGALHDEAKKQNIRRSA